MASAKGIVFTNDIVILKTMLFEDIVVLYGSLDPLGSASAATGVSMYRCEGGNRSIGVSVRARQSVYRCIGARAAIGVSVYRCARGVSVYRCIGAKNV